jgi:hypothetical protein
MSVLIGIAWLAVIAYLVISVVWYFAVAYPQGIYPLDQAKGWINQADSTSDLKVMADNLGKALTILDKYEGNPVWWYPTPTTSFDEIKHNIEESIDLAIDVSEKEGTGSFAYQQAVHNLQDNVLENLKERMSDAGHWLVVSREWLVMCIGWLIVLMAAIIITVRE